MKILLLTSRLPWPVDRGDRNRTFHFLKEMTTKHDVRLLTFLESDAERAGVEHVEALGAEVVPVVLSPFASRRNMARAIASARPFQVAYYDSRAMRRLAAEQAPDRDVVIAHLVRMAPYLDEVPRGARRVIDFCDCISSEYEASLPHRTGFAKMFFREEGRRMARYERDLAASVDEGWLISAAEIEKLSPGNPRLHVVPIGVPVRTGARPPRRDEGLRVVFTGNLSVPHNVDAARHLVEGILPHIAGRIPGTRVTLAGAAPAPAVRALAGPGVEVTGWVDDLTTVFDASDVFLAPMRFVAGVQTKVLDAMASGLPVVTSDLVRRGLGATAGEHVLVGEHPEGYANHVIGLFEEPERARRLGDAGRAFVRERYRWRAVLDRLEPVPAPPPS